MKFSEYQKLANQTDRVPKESDSKDHKSITVPMLGLAGESGQLLTEYKKHLRDGDAHELYKERVSEELGDLLWYVSNIASKFELNLDEIATKNLEKVNSRWKVSESKPRDFDALFSESESLPRKFKAKFCEEYHEGRLKAKIQVYGKGIDTNNSNEFGDPLTDNSHDPDGYRFHDVFHFAYAALLGWSPVTRKFTEHKRKSREIVDEVEDGARARVVEEGISALVFEYARNHRNLKNVSAVDSQLLRTIKDMTSNLEVKLCTTHEWEQAILEGFRVWRLVLKNKGGIVKLDLDKRTIQYKKIN